MRGDVLVEQVDAAAEAAAVGLLNPASGGCEPDDGGPCARHVGDDLPLHSEADLQARGEVVPLGQRQPVGQARERQK